MTDGKAQKNSAASGGEPSQLAARIQSTLVSNCVTQAQWENHIAECLHYRFQAAMIPAAWVKKTAEKLHGTGIKVASFIDLPLGTMTSSGKAYEAGRLVAEGAEEIDLMPNIGFLISGMEKEYFADIRGVVEAAGERPVKVMLELPLLNAQQKERAVTLSVEAGVAYLKNASSGAVGVAKVEEIRFLRERAPANVRVKASGGIKTARHVKELLEAGADLVGTSAAVQIVKEQSGGSGQEPDKSSLPY